MHRQEPDPGVAAASGQAAIDTLRRLETPEGVEITLRLAGPVPRAAAFAIDLLIRTGLYLVLLPLAGLAGLGVGLLLLALFLLEWFYPVVFELMRGATPGKRALGLVVVHADGTPVGPAASLLRNLLRGVDFLPLFYGLGLATMLVDRDFRRLGDLAAGTLVIHREPAATAAPLPADPPRAPARPLDLATQQAILAFAERSTALSAERRTELARLAGLAARDEPDPAAALLGIASWISRGHPDETTAARRAVAVAGGDGAPAA